MNEALMYERQYPERNLKKFTEITSFQASTQINEKAQSNLTNSLYQSKKNFLFCFNLVY